MAVEDEAKEVARTMGRGRRESAPWYVQTSVLLVVAAFAAVVIAAALALYYLTR